MLSSEEQRVLEDTRQRNIIRAKMRALRFRLLTCMDDERQEIEEKLAVLRLELKKISE